MIDLFPHVFYYGTQKVLLIGIAWKVGCQSLGLGLGFFWPSRRSLLYISNIVATFRLAASLTGVLTIYWYNDFKLTVHSNGFCLPTPSVAHHYLLITSLSAETRILYSIQNNKKKRLNYEPYCTPALSAAPLSTLGSGRRHTVILVLPFLGRWILQATQPEELWTITQYEYEIAC